MFDEILGFKLLKAGASFLVTVLVEKAGCDELGIDWESVQLTKEEAEAWDAERKAERVAKKANAGKEL